jgi:hypothetical protein
MFLSYYSDGLFLFHSENVHFYDFTEAYILMLLKKIYLETNGNLSKLPFIINKIYLGEANKFRLLQISIFL